jgi:hypothetical protein
LKSEPADTCTDKFLLMSIGGQAEGLVYADPVVRIPIGVSGNLVNKVTIKNTM